MSDYFTAYFLNLFVNSLLSFFTVWVFVELLILLIRMKNSRIKVLFRLLPLCKITLDPFLYDFSSWAFLQGIDPLKAEKGSRTLIASLQYEGFQSWLPVFLKLQMFTESGAAFTLPDVLFSFYNSIWLKAGIVMFTGGTALKVFLHQKRRKAAQKYLQEVFKESVPCHAGITNKQLEKSLKESSVSVLEREKVDSPFAFWYGKHYIVFPNVLLQRLSQKEYEAILGHELEHIHWRDGFIKQILFTLRDLFWWIPSKKLFQTLEHSTEMACDQAIHNYGIDPVDLAGALLKTARLKKGYDLPELCYFKPGLCVKNFGKHLDFDYQWFIKTQPYYEIWRVFYRSLRIKRLCFPCF